MAGFKQTILDKEPVLFITFDGDDFDPVTRLLTASPKTIIDESGRGNHGTLLFDQEEYPGYRMGLPSLVELEQSDQYSISFGWYGSQPIPGGYAKAWIEVPHSDDFMFPELGSFSVSLMMRRDSNEQAWRNYKDSIGGSSSGTLYRPIARKGLAFYMRYRDNPTGSDALEVVHPGGTLSWNIPSSGFYGENLHLVFVWKVTPLPGSQFRADARLYVNGYIVAEQTFLYYDDVPDTNNSSSWEIGGTTLDHNNRDDDRNTSNVQIDQFAVFDRALEDDDVTQIFKKTRSYTRIIQTTPGVVNYWPLDDNESVADFTAKAAVGTFDGTYLGGNSRVIRRRPGPPSIQGSLSTEFRDGGMLALHRTYSAGGYMPVFNPNGDFTIEFMFRATTNERGVLFSLQQDDYPYTGMLLELNQRDNAFSAGMLQFTVSEGIWLNSRELQDNGATRFAFNDGNWYHVAMIRRGTTLELWINGVLHSSRSVSPNQMKSAGPGQAYLMGMMPGKLNVEGNAAHVAFYNTALQPSQIRARSSYNLVYRIRGTVTLQGAPYRGLVRIYRHFDGSLITELYSSATTGFYMADLFDNTLVDVVVLSPTDRDVRMRAFGPITPAMHEDI